MPVDHRFATRAITVFLASSSFVAVAAAQAPSQPDAGMLRADSLYQAHNYAAAADAYVGVVRSHPDAGVYWYRLGVALHLTGRKQEAAPAYARAIALNVGAPAMYNLGTLNASLGSRDSAFYWLNQAVANGFTNESTISSDSELAPLRNDSRYAQLLERVRVAAEPCMARPESRQFDFWVGDWDVTNAANQAAGKSSVQLLLGGCTLLENWASLSGGAGKSLNAYNPHVKMWQQFWTDQSGNVTEYRDGEFVNGSIRLTAHAQLPRGPGLVRMTFTPVSKDLVRQLGELSLDNGTTWTTNYDFYYHRRAK